MSTEDRIRRLIRSSGEPPAASEHEWQKFIAVAHRNRFLHRAAHGMVAALLVVGGGAGIWAVAERVADDPIAPADRGPVDPAPIPFAPPQECPDVEPYEPESDLGAIAFVRNGHVYRVDVGGDAVDLVAGSIEMARDVEWSPDGRWISFGEGLVVPASGGPVCAPMGVDVSEPTWGAGNTLVGLREGRLVVGGPGRDAQQIDIPDRTIVSYALDPDGERVAVQAHKPKRSGMGFNAAEIHIVDLASGETTRILELNGGSTPQIAGWSPDGESILFWRATVSASLDADGIPLEIVSASGGAPTRITDAMVPRKDFIDWCGERLIFADGFDRLEPAGHSLGQVVGPNWGAEPLSWDRSLSWYGPTCSPDEDVVAANTVPDGARPDAPRSITLLEVPSGRVVDEFPPGNADRQWQNPTKWSPDGEWLLVELREASPAVTHLYLFGRPDSQIEIAELGFEVETFDTKQLYDWFLP